MLELEKRPYENERQYLWRIGQYVYSGQIKNWEAVTPVINAQCRDNESEYRDESAYRKPVQCARAFYEDVFSQMMDDEYAQQIAQQTEELYKIKRQVQDQRREYNKLLTADARADHLTDCMLEVVERMNTERPLDFGKDNVAFLSTGENDGVLVFADWHYGLVTDNIWNTYNVEICKARVCKLVRKAKSFIALNKVENLYILLLGDSYHGAIHNGCRVASEEDTCDQLMHVAELMANAIAQISKVVKSVKVYSTYGNHARTIQNKKDSIHSDNMEKIIPWWMKQRLQNEPTIEIIDSKYKEFIELNVKGYDICGVHGDLDKFKDLGLTVNALFTKLFGLSIDYTISADKHHLEEFEQFGIESILVRSLCGTDEYANKGRFYSSAGQSLFIFNEEDGRVATYNIKL